MNSPFTARSQLAAFAIVAAPGVAALVALVAFGVLDWLYGGLAVVFVLVVLGDRDELAQVFQNLIDNAVKYGVRLRCGKSTKSALLQRADPD